MHEYFILFSSSVVAALILAFAVAARSALRHRPAWPELVPLGAALVLVAVAAEVEEDADKGAARVAVNVGNTGHGVAVSKIHEASSAGRIAVVGGFWDDQL